MRCLTTLLHSALGDVVLMLVLLRFLGPFSFLCFFLLLLVYGVRLVLKRRKVDIPDDRKEQDKLVFSRLHQQAGLNDAGGFCCV